MKKQNPTAKIVAHPECKTSVASHADFLGSTSQMINYVKKTESNTFFLLTECGLTSRLQLESPQKTFIGSCTLCQYMKANSLQNILQCLENPSKESIITLPTNIQEKAYQCIQKMFEYA